MRRYDRTLDKDLDGPRLRLTLPVVTALETLLPSYRSDEQHEGVVYLGGLSFGLTAVALTAIAPTAETTRGSFQTNLDANTQVVRALAEHGLVLVGQVHSHPGDWVGHSKGDDSGALVRFEGYWSLVVPRYAAQGIRPLSRCGVHCFRHGRFARLTKGAIQARVRITPVKIDLRLE